MAVRQPWFCREVGASGVRHLLGNVGGGCSTVRYSTVQYSMAAEGGCGETEALATATKAASSGCTRSNGQLGLQKERGQMRGGRCAMVEAEGPSRRSAMTEGDGDIAAPAADGGQGCWGREGKGQGNVVAACAEQAGVGN